MKYLQSYNLLILWFSGCVIGLASLVPNPPSQVPFNKAGEEPILNVGIESFIHGLLDEWNSPGGAAVAVVRMNDRGIWNIETKGYGSAKADGTPVDENTLFAIASNSKLFTAIATGLLVSNETLEPRIEWSSKIASLIPGWALMDPIATQESTILDLMGHRTGQPRDDFMYGRRDDTSTILRKIKHLKPSAGFREIWQYNNNMYSFLSTLPGLLVPGTNFTQYVKENVFDPLGMLSTTYSYEVAAKTGRLAEGMARQGANMSEDVFGGGIPRALPFWSQENGTAGNFSLGAGGVIMNAIDAATWLQALLLEGKSPHTNASIIPAAVIHRVSTGISVASGSAPFPELSPSVYGGGQSRSSYRGHELVEHEGGIPGFMSTISRFPSDMLGVAVFVNDDMYGGQLSRIIKSRLADAVLGLDPIDWNSRYKTLVARRPQPTPRPPAPSDPSYDFAALHGIYENPGYGTFELCPLGDLSKPSPVTAACKTLISELPTILPGSVDPDVPTLVAKWERAWATHLTFAHFDGDVFNVTAINSLPTGDPSVPYWTYSMEAGMMVNAEFSMGPGENSGFGFTGGLWGAGPGVPSPSGKTIHERAEVWFKKV